jgi:hypothetical protein
VTDTIRVSNDRLAAIVNRAANNFPVRWYADARGDQSRSHAAIECFLRPGLWVDRLIADFIEHGFVLVSCEPVGDFHIYRFEAERDLGQ